MRQGWWHQLLRRPHRALAWPCFHCLGFSLATPVPPAPSHGFSPRSQPAAAPRARPGLRPKRLCQFLQRPCATPVRFSAPPCRLPPSSTVWNRGSASRRRAALQRRLESRAGRSATWPLPMALLDLSQWRFSVSLHGASWSLSPHSPWHCVVPLNQAHQTVRIIRTALQLRSPGLPARA